MTLAEMSRLQGFPPLSSSVVSRVQLGQVLGNTMTVDVVKEVLRAQMEKMLTARYNNPVKFLLKRRLLLKTKFRPKRTLNNKTLKLIMNLSGMILSARNVRPMTINTSINNRRLGYRGSLHFFRRLFPLYPLLPLSLAPVQVNLQSM